MSSFDYVVTGIVLISLLLGVWRGVVGELISLAAWVLAFLAASHFGSAIGQSLFQGMSDAGMRALAGCAVAFVSVLLGMALVRLAASSVIKALGLSLSDRLLGLCFGFVRGVLIAMVLVALGGLTSAPQQIWWKEAVLSGPLETAVLATKEWLPADLAKKIRFR